MAFLAETRRRCRQRPLLFLSLLLLAVLALAAADQTQERWTDDKCDRKFKPNYVSCVPQMSNSCTCKKAYWKKIDPGTHCCHKNAVQKCASINTTLVPEFGSCTLHPKCNWSPWTITGCTTACGEGQNKYLRTCSSNSATEAKTGGTCGETPAAWTEWHITPCSVSCGDGTETHSRNCVGTCAGTCKRGVTQTEKASCTVGVPYQWTAWSDFGLCSNSCGPGTHTRKRTCFGNCNAGNSACALNAVETQTQDCFSGEPSSWSDWTPWGACEACNFGTQSRTRTCDGSCSGNCSLHAQESQSRVCAGSRPSGWSQWTPWSTWCNVDCGEGNVTSRKTCEGECEATCTIGTVETRTKTCTNPFPALSNPWSQWTDCEVCGEGMRNRTRQCSRGCENEECPVSGALQVETSPCEPASWSEWGETSPSCTTTCGMGVLYHNRTCVGACQPEVNATCTLDAVEVGTRPCSAGAPASWGEWSCLGCNDLGVRAWQRACEPNCYGECEGDDVRNEICDWESVDLWAGPIDASSAEPLSMSIAEAIADLLASTLQALDGILFGAVEPVLLTAPDGSEERRRRAVVINESLSWTEHALPGHVWVEYALSYFPGRYETATSMALALRVNVSSVQPELNSTLSFVQSPPYVPDSPDDEPGTPPPVTTPATAPSPSPPAPPSATTPDPIAPTSSKSSGAMPAIAGGVLGCIVIVAVVLFLLYRRRQPSAKKRMSKKVSSQPGDDRFAMITNPAYRTNLHPRPTVWHKELSNDYANVDDDDDIIGPVMTNRMAWAAERAHTQRGSQSALGESPFGMPKPSTVGPGGVSPDRYEVPVGPGGGSPERYEVPVGGEVDYSRYEVPLASRQPTYQGNYEAPVGGEVYYSSGESVRYAIPGLGSSADHAAQYHDLDDATHHDGGRDGDYDNIGSAASGVSGAAPPRRGASQAAEDHYGFARGAIECDLPKPGSSAPMVAEYDSPNPAPAVAPQAEYDSPNPAPAVAPQAEYDSPNPAPAVATQAEYDSPNPGAAAPPTAEYDKPSVYPVPVAARSAAAEYDSPHVAPLPLPFSAEYDSPNPGAAEYDSPNPGVSYSAEYDSPNPGGGVVAAEDLQLFLGIVATCSTRMRTTDAAKLLAHSGAQNGVYLVHQSSSQPDCLVLTAWARGHPAHERFRLLPQGGVQYGQKRFRSLLELLRHTPLSQFFGVTQLKFAGSVFAATAAVVAAQHGSERWTGERVMYEAELVSLAEELALSGKVAARLGLPAGPLSVPVAQLWRCFYGGEASTVVDSRV